MKDKRSQVVLEVLRYLENRFGIPKEVFASFGLVEAGDVWVSSPEALRFEAKVVRRRGMRLARVHKKGFKLTTAAIQVFGKYARKNVVTLRKKEEVASYIRGEDLKLESREGIEDGQVIVKYEGDILGSGLLKGDTLKNQIPKGRRIPIRF